MELLHVTTMRTSDGVALLQAVEAAKLLNASVDILQNGMESLFVPNLSYAPVHLMGCRNFRYCSIMFYQSHVLGFGAKEKG